MPIVSVVIPTRNRAGLLERAVKSVEKQTYKDLEIIVVDDSSSDNTQSVIESLKTENLRYIRLEKQSGGAVARNTGIKAAGGRFIAFLDDDDEWLPEKIEKQATHMLNNPGTGICYTGRKTIRKGKMLLGGGKRYSFRYPPGEDHFKAIMSDNFVGITSSVMIPRDILLEAGGFDEKLPCLQDYDLYIRILKKTKAFGINEPLVRYYLEGATRHVSFERANVETASAYLIEKYMDEPYLPLLKKAIKKINIKKMLKSFSFAREVLTHRFK